MASSVVFEDRIEIPYFRLLAEFRQWASSDDFPEQGRIDYIRGRIEVDMSPENVFFHGSVKTEVVVGLGRILKFDRGRPSFQRPHAGFLPRRGSLRRARRGLRLGRRLGRGPRLPRAKPSGEPDSYVELEGVPDLVVEIVSDSSVAKDTQRLPLSYWQAGVTEYWWWTCAAKRLSFQIYSRRNML